MCLNQFHSSWAPVHPSFILLSLCLWEEEKSFHLKPGDLENKDEAQSPGLLFSAARIGGLGCGLETASGAR